MPELPSRDSKVPATLFAAGLTAVVFLLQFLYVHASFGGNWTALFMTGSTIPLPSELAPGTWVFSESDGYDGQLYRYLAHDPTDERNLFPSTGEFVYRGRRILVPAIARAVVLGRPGLIDAAFIATILGFVFLGVWWTAAVAVRHGRPLWWGGFFLAVPATIISAQRMTVDVATAALTAGFFYFASGAGVGLYAVLTALVLSRETGALAVAAVSLWFLWERRYRHSIAVWGTTLPALTWYAWLASKLRATEGDSGLGLPDWLGVWPDFGLVRHILDPVVYEGGSWLGVILTQLDRLALAALLLAIWWSVVALLKEWREQGRANLATLTVFTHAGLFLLVDREGYWVDLYGWARPFSPVLLAWLVHWWQTGSRMSAAMALLPTVFIDLRLGIALGSYGIAIFKMLFGMADATPKELKQPQPKPGAGV